MHFRGGIGVWLVGFMLALAACQGLSTEPRIVATIPSQSSSAATTGQGQEDIAAVMTLGGTVWMANCAECHGRTGEGTEIGAPLPDLTNHTDEQILAAISNGNDIMPAFGERLTPDELNAAMTYSKMMSLAISRGMVDGAESAPADSSAAPTEVAQAAPAESANAVMGVVTGQVTHGTAGAALPENLPVALHVFKSEFEEEILEGATNPDGTYRFENVAFYSTYQYVVTAPYGDVMFVSNIVTIDPSLPEVSLPITIYEGGAPESAIQISAISAQLMAQDDTMQIIQIVSFVNTSDRVYFDVTEDEATSVRLHLPQNASLLSSVSNRYVLSDDGTQMYSTRPVMPGESHMMHVAYSMPYDQSASVDQLLDYPLAGPVEVVVATSGLSLSGEGFGTPQQVTMGDLPMTSYSGQMALDAGSTLRYQVSGVPAPAQTDSGATSVLTSPIAYVFIGAGVSAFVIAAILALRDRVRPKTAAGKATMGDLLEQIATLDSQHADGKVNTREYNRKRTALKSQLSDLMKSQ